MSFCGQQSPSSSCWCNDTVCRDTFRKSEEIAVVQESPKFLVVCGQCSRLANLGVTLTSFKNRSCLPSLYSSGWKEVRLCSRFMWMKRTIWLSNQFAELCPNPMRLILFTWTPHGLSEDSSARNQLGRNNQVHWIASSLKDGQDEVWGLQIKVFTASLCDIFSESLFMPFI